MYAADQSATASQGNAKSCIQALLRNRELHPHSLRRSRTSKKDFFHSSFLNSATADNFDPRIVAQNLEIISSNQEKDNCAPSKASSSDSSEAQKDFNYSQKLFHIADGNLYSIFSPIQGRSYGMKPSFLRKQKYTVQECHSRGRKNLRKGLKFHNFLPSESVTSEKDDDFLRTNWKVHSECRLREEHGTKQITISNWSQNVSDSPGDTVKSESGLNPNCDVTKPSTSFDNGSNVKSRDNIDPYDFNLSLENSPCSPDLNRRSVIAEFKNKDVPTDNSKKKALDSVLNNLLDKAPTTNEEIDDKEMDSYPSYQSNKHRRKPLQTRRVVPYVKYLSIIEENDSLPLDLSSKCVPSENTTNGNCVLKTSLSVIESNSTTICGSPKDSSPHSLSNRTNLSGDNLGGMSVSNAQSSNSAPLTFLCPIPIGKSVNIPSLFPHKEHDFNMNYEIHHNENQLLKLPNSPSKVFATIAYPPVSNAPVQYSAQKSYMKDVQSRSRRRNQRSVIKQKLEDTFRQNGFLVKTKQVSDGEATFCKFRQLRKYTRYYLKSWQQHLPDEVHKMWKGFLPPKTVLPPVSGNVETTSKKL